MSLPFVLYVVNLYNQRVLLERVNMRYVMALFLIFTILSPLSSGFAEQLIISGCSVSYIGYLRDLANEYERLTGVKVFVRGGGSIAGLENLREQSSDMAATCREPMGDENLYAEFIQVAWDALVFIVHKSNDLENITLDNARDIFLGRITNYRQLGGSDKVIRLFIGRSARGHQGVEVSLSQMLLKGKSPVVGSNAKVVPSGGIVEQMIERTLEGFAASGFTSARKRDVKILKVNGVYPSKENIIKNRYPLKRPLYLVVPKNPPSKVKRLVDFVMSEQGQRFISSLGAISLLDIR